MKQAERSTNIELPDDMPPVERVVDVGDSVCYVDVDISMSWGGCSKDIHRDIKNAWLPMFNSARCAHAPHKERSLPLRISEPPCL